MERRHRAASLPTKRSSNTTGRAVFAHVVMGNWQSFELADWLNDIKLAQVTGIDAFALNVGGDDSDPTQLKLAYTAAETLGFKVFVSLDMTYTVKFGTAANILAEYVTPYATRTGQFKYNGQPLLSTFSGETSATYLDGNSNINAAWASLKALAKAQSIDLFFMPFWTSLEASTAVSAHPAIDGIGNWLAWPTTNAAPSVAIDLAFETDALANSKVYCATVSPWFNVHLTSDNNYIYRSDDHLLATRFEQLISMKEVPQMIELVTWNDYGESHYLGPVRNASGLPTGTVDSSAYVEDVAHQSILGLVKLYIEYYKTGSFPNVTDTQAFYWYRSHPKAAVATSDPLGIPTNAAWTDDNLYLAVVVAEGSAVTTVRIDMAGTTTDHAVVTGKVNLIKAPFTAGVPTFTLLSSSSAVIRTRTGPTITSTPIVYDFNYRTGSFSET